jgi:hypothetical protein
MASKVAGQFAHMKNVAAEFVRAKPNRACPTQTRLSPRRLSQRRRWMIIAFSPSIPIDKPSTV